MDESNVLMQQIACILHEGVATGNDSGSRCKIEEAEHTSSIMRLVVSEKLIVILPPLPSSKLKINVTLINLVVITMYNICQSLLYGYAVIDDNVTSCINDKKINGIDLDDRKRILEAINAVLTTHVSATSH